VLRIEGTLFCFDPKEAKRRRRHHHQPAQGRRWQRATGERAIHPTSATLGLAYKIVQAIFLKDD
jgi:hypothetical protein